MKTSRLFCSIKPNMHLASLVVCFVDCLSDGMHVSGDVSRSFRLQKVILNMGGLGIKLHPDICCLALVSTSFLPLLASLSLFIYMLAILTRGLIELSLFVVQNCVSSLMDGTKIS